MPNVQISERFKFRYTLTFRLSEGVDYAVDNVLNLIVKEMITCRHNLSFDTATRFDGSPALGTTDTRVSQTATVCTENAICPSCIQERRKHKTYLQKRLQEAVQKGDFEVRESIYNRARMLAPYKSKSHDEYHEWWALNAYIAGTDLIKFCKGERIRVVFSEQQVTPTHDLSLNDPSRSEPPPLATWSTADYEDTNTAEEPPRPCPEVGKTFIRKLAFDIAWHIECNQEGKKATADQVIKELQKMAESDHQDPDSLRLTLAIPLGVEWRTSKLKDAKFTIGACEKALSEWDVARIKLEGKQKVGGR